MKSYIAAVALALPGTAQAAECLIGTHPGIDDADAETVTAIVCDELRKRGVPVGEPVIEAAAETEVYRTTLRPLGRKVYLAVYREDAAGTQIGESQVLLEQIEDVPVAARRLAETLVTGKSLESTATVSTLVGENETRRYRKKYGEDLYGLGVTGMVVPGTDVYPGAGLLFRGSFETESFGVLGDLRFAWSDEDENGGDEAFLFSATVGGRWFMLAESWTPYLGGGVGFAVLDVNDLGDSGLGAYAEVGVELLRFYESRLSLDVRADLPFFLVHEEFNEDDEEYFVPLSFSVAYLF